MLRILKLLRFMPSLRVFWSAIISARHQLILFYSFIAIVMIIFGALMYLIEGPKYGFTTLNASVYWAIVTVTTVGTVILRRIRRWDVLSRRCLF